MFIKRLPTFEYHAPSTIEEALEAISMYNKDGKVFAGGTDILVSMKKREVVPKHLINLTNLENLKGITYEKGVGVRIGSLTPLGEIERSGIIKDHFPPLWDAIKVIAAPQIRNLGTIGGNLCSAIPSADTPPPLIVLKATLKLVTLNGERTVQVEDFFKGRGESILKPGELLTEIFIPDLSDQSAGAYIKLMRRKAMDLALVGVAAFLKLNDNRNTCKEARIALGAVAPTPMRAKMAEKILINGDINENLAAESGKVASQEARPITDIRATKEYRTEMVEVLTRRAVLMAVDRLT